MSNIMTPEERKLLERAVELGEENQKLIKKMYRRHIWTYIITILKWIVFIGIAIWSYILIVPWVERLHALYQQVQETSDTVNEIRVKTGEAFQLPSVDATDLQNLYDMFKINDQ